MHVRFVIRFLVLALVAGFFTNALLAAPVDARRNVRYQMTEKHGPWMIMVASFHERPRERRGKGLTPQQAADELVYELRKSGLPAYSFSMKDVVKHANNKKDSDYLYRNHERYRGSVTVLAGNYRNPKDQLAQKTLTYIKKYHPNFLGKTISSAGKTKIWESGGVFKATPGKPNPLSGAHLTPNPLLSPAEIRNSRGVDPLILKWNSGEYSLLNNPGKETLIIATFMGGSKLKRPRSDKKKNLHFDKRTLGGAAGKAWELAKLLRKKNVKAWIYHDRYSSKVTVGSFSSGKDPRIRMLIKKYGAKKQRDSKGRPVLKSEWLTIPERLYPGQKFEKYWLFDPEPRLMIVPKVSR